MGEGDAAGLDGGLGAEGMGRGEGGDTDTGGVLFTTPEGPMIVHEPCTFRQHEERTLFFRSEDATLLPHPPRAGAGMTGNIIRGILEDLDFFGDEIRAVIRGHGGGRFTLKLIPGQTSFDPWEMIGKDVEVRVERVGVIPRDGM